MRFNEKEIATLAAEPGDKEGRLHYRSPGFREVYKERWFKLKGNLLFYFRLNEYGAVYEKEPVGVLVIEECRIQCELYAEFPHAFSITFVNEHGKRHHFGCVSQKQVEEWTSCLRVCSYEQQRSKLKELQEKIIKLTGRDPLSTFSSNQSNVILEEKTDESDCYFDRVHVFAKNSSNITTSDFITFT